MIISWLLVVGQMILIVLLAFPVSALYQGTLADLFGVSLVICSLVLVVWAFLSMHSGTFTVMPEPTSAASLTQAGPYQYVRHPMYSAVLVGGVGASISHADIVSWLQLSLLSGLLIVKLLREERYLSQRYGEYSDYKKRTRALVPWVY
ncbi:MAG: isoprenylcysteine carboxylmethyltransferase family protein [Granulosicoccus sp.]